MPEVEPVQSQRVVSKLSGYPQSAQRHRKSLALAAVCLGSFMTMLDGSAVNIALPAIQRDVHGSISSVQWVLSAYTIPVASLLLTAGDLADRLGARRLFGWSLGLFTLASLLCALSPTLTLLLAARTLQGIMAGGLLPTTLAIVTRTYADPVERARAITVWGATGAVALVIGPVGGGLLTDAFGWRSIFLINVPVGLATLALATRSIAETARRHSRSVDVAGQLSGVLALASLVAALIEGGERGWSTPPSTVLLITAGAGIVAFVLIEHRSSHPALPPAMFRQPAFTASVVSGFAYQFGSFGLQFMLANYLQERWRLSAAHTGWLFLPFSVSGLIGILVLNRRLIHRGPRWLLWTGASTALLGALILLPVSGPASWPALIAGSTLIGLGCGVFAPSINVATMMSIEPEFAGLGSGVLNTARQIGMAIGVALLGAFIGMPDALLGLRWCLGLIALCFLLILLLSLRYAPRTAAEHGR